MDDVERCFNMRKKIEEEISKRRLTGIKFQEDHHIVNSECLNMICEKYIVGIYPDDGSFVLYVELSENNDYMMIKPCVFHDFDQLMQEFKRISDL